MALFTPDSMPGKLLRLPLQLIPRNAEVRILRGPGRGRRWIAGSSVHTYWLGTYESEKVNLFMQHVRAGSVVYDLGAHVGYYTLLAAARAGESGRVIAFEPDPRNLGYLHKHVDLNRLDNVVIVPKAVSSTTSPDVPFRRGRHPATGSLSVNGDLLVESVTLDDFVLTQSHPAPTVVKIDIEGAEVGALEGARRVLELHRPVVFVAAHGEDAGVECRALLDAAGYDIKALQDPEELVAQPRPT